MRTSLAPARASRSASPIPDPISGDEGRERRVRKSVNYTEPKLNTYVLSFGPRRIASTPILTLDPGK